MDKTILRLDRWCRRLMDGASFRKPCTRAELWLPWKDEGGLRERLWRRLKAEVFGTSNPTFGLTPFSRETASLRRTI